ncbi:MAG: hypothetical protein WA160_15435 [Pseudobdellovibrio sp.]
MRFKVFLLAAISTLSFSCGLKFNEKKEENEVVEVKSAKCLDQSVKELKLYFKGDATDDQATNSFQCLEEVFSAFRDNIRGQTNGEYTPQEIASFVQMNFIKDASTFSNSFLDELMKFKVALLGGSTDVISKSEITQLVDLLSSMKPELVKLNKYMKIVTLNWNKELQPHDEVEKEQMFLQSKAELSKVIQIIMTKLQLTQRSYQIDDFLNFIEQVAIFANVPNDSISEINKYRELIKKTKTLLLGGDYSLQQQEWNGFGLLVHEGLFQFLRNEYFLKDLANEQFEPKWEYYQKIAFDLSALVENLLNSKSTKSFTTKELYELLLLAQTFSPKLNFSENILSHIGDFKVIFFGDQNLNPNIWSATDFANLNSKISEIFKHSESLIMAYDVIKPSATVAVRPTYTDFSDNEIKIITAIDGLNNLVINSYDLINLKAFVIELSEGPLKESFKLPKNFDSLFKVFLSLKTLITEHSDSNVSASNIQLLLNIGSRAYLNYLQFDLYLKTLNAKQPEFFENVEYLWQKVSLTIQTNLKLKNNSYFSSPDILLFLSVLQSEDFLTRKLKLESADLLLQGLWKNLLLSPNLRLAGKVLPGFNTEALSQISLNVVETVRAQKALAKIFQKNRILTQTDLKAELLQVSQQPNAVDYGSAITELIQIVGTKVPLNFDENGFLKILSADVGNYNFNDMFRSNLARAFSRWIIRAYANDETRVDQVVGLTLAEANVAFGQFRAVAVDFDAIDENNISFISARFLEANLFLSGSNGDEYLNLIELHNLSLHILSGLARADMLKSTIMKKCLPDFVGKPSSSVGIPEDCLLQVYFDEENAFANMPEHTNLKNQFTQDLLKDYYMSLLKAAGHVPNAYKIVYLADADLFPHVVQYLEMIYASYDSVKDNRLTQNEALAAFPVFQKTIKDVAKIFSPSLKDENLPGTFIYLLKNTRPPKTLSEKLAFAAFISKPDSTKPDKWAIQTTRLDLGKIFNLIADSTKPTVATVKN